MRPRALRVVQQVQSDDTREDEEDASEPSEAGRFSQEQDSVDRGTERADPHL